MYKRYFLQIAVLVFAVILTGFPAWAVPGLVNYQGKLTDPNGLAINGDHLLSFSIFNTDTGEAPLWTESQSISVVNGIYNVQLGSIEPLGLGITNYDSLYLEVKIDDETVSPRVPITSTVFAFKAGVAGDADTVDGFDSAVFAQKAHTHDALDIVSGALADARIADNIVRDIEVMPIVLDNDGPGSTLNADLLDGKTSTEFLDTSITTQTKLGGLNIMNRIGIGTTKPGERLDIDGNLRFTEQGITRSIYLEQSDGIDEPGRDLEIYAGECNAQIIETLPGGDLRLHGGRGEGIAGGNVYVYGGDYGSNTRPVGNVILAHNGTDAGGKVGIGTTTPFNELHVEGQTYINEALGIRTTVNYPSETAIQIGSIVDPDKCKNSPVASIRENGAACGGLYVYADSSWSGYFGGGDFIIDGGNVGIGTTSPSYKLDVAGVIRGDNVSPSDIRLKKNITTIENALEKVSHIRGIYFDWKDKEERETRNMGLIAQEVEKTFPEVISKDQEGYKSINYGKLIAALVEAVKELKLQNEELKARIETLEQNRYSYSGGDFL